MAEPRPVRIQRKRTKGWRLAGANPNGLPVVYVGRGSPYGNPFVPGKHHPYDWDKLGEPLTLDECRELFREVILPTFDGDELARLRGRNVMCWCREDAPWCHGDDLLEAAQVRGDDGA